MRTVKQNYRHFRSIGYCAVVAYWLARHPGCITHQTKYHPLVEETVLIDLKLSVACYQHKRNPVDAHKRLPYAISDRYYGTVLILPNGKAV